MLFASIRVICVIRASPCYLVSISVTPTPKLVVDTG